jgi:hypothetical protein
VRFAGVGGERSFNGIKASVSDAGSWLGGNGEAWIERLLSAALPLFAELFRVCRFFDSCFFKAFAEQVFRDSRQGEISSWQNDQIKGFTWRNSQATIGA